MIEFVVKRPVTVLMFYIAVLIIGFISFSKLPLELKPSTEYPALNIYVNWANASPETIESKVTAPIESQISGLSNIYKISSTSRVSRSNIKIEYLRDTDMNFAYMDLNEKLFIIKKDLPDDVKRSVRITKYIPQGFADEDDNDILTYQIYGDQKLFEIYQIVEDKVKDKISNIAGVSNVSIYGSSAREIKILIDRDKANALSLSPQFIKSRIEQFGQLNDVGIVNKNGKEYNIVINNKFIDISELKDIFIRYTGKVPIKLKDIATIKDALGDNYNLNRINGSATVSLSVIKESGVNAIEVADEVISEIEKLGSFFKENNIEIILSNNSTEEMREQLDDIKTRSIFSLIVIAIILLLFLRDVKTPIFIILTIFFSLLITFTFLYFIDYTINIMTISGLALGLGLLVDNSIVVIENIYQYYKNGYSKLEASIKGTKEVMMPILTATLTTVTVFLPFMYLSGDKQLQWTPLAIAVSLSLLASLIVSFTFTPTITNLMLKKRPDSERKILPVNFKINDNSFFHTFLSSLINNKVITVLFVGIFFYFSFFLFDQYVDKGSIFNFGRDDSVQLYISMPTGSTIEMSNKIITRFEKRIKEVGGYEKFTTRVGSNYANVRITYTDDGFNSIKPFTMEEELISIAHNFSGPRITVRNPLNTAGGYSAGGTTSKSFSNRILMKGYSYNELKKNAEQLEKYLRKNRRINDVDINATSGWWRSNDLFNYIFEINRKKIAEFNTSISNVYYFIRSSIGGSYPSQMVIGGTEASYSVKFSDYKDFNVDQLKDLVYKFGEKDFRVKEIGDIVKTPMMNEITKEDQAYTRLIKFDYRGTSKNANKFETKLIDTYPLPPGYSFDQPTYNYMTDEDEKEILFILFLSVILVFMVTASLFESFWHPLVVILTVPLGLTGVFLIFFFLDETFNQDAYMGAILLAGIAVNNSIILINHINDLRKEGLNLKTAIIVGTSQRVRPILMTTATTVIGIMPLIINSEADVNFWYTLALTTVGGLIASTIFVLTVIPVLYAGVERFKQILKKGIVSLARS